MASGQDILGQSGQTACFSKAGLAEGTAANTIKTAAPNGVGIDYTIDGVMYHKADTDSIAVTAHAQQAVSTSALYLVQIDSSGMISTKKGNEALTTHLGVRTALQWPMPDKGRCALGGYKIGLDAATTFTNGSTDLGAAGVTDTFFDFGGGLPLSPQVS